MSVVRNLSLPWIFSSNPLISLYSIAPTWYVFNGTIITFILGLILSFIFGKTKRFKEERNNLLKNNFSSFLCVDSKDSKPVDKSLIMSRGEIFPCCSSKKVSLITMTFITWFFSRELSNQHQCRNTMKFSWIIQASNVNRCLRLEFVNNHISKEFFKKLVYLKCLVTWNYRF